MESQDISKLELRIFLLDEDGQVISKEPFKTSLDNKELQSCLVWVFESNTPVKMLSISIIPQGEKT